MPLVVAFCGSTTQWFTLLSLRKYIVSTAVCWIFAWPLILTTATAGMSLRLLGLRSLGFGLRRLWRFLFRFYLCASNMYLNWSRPYLQSVPLLVRDPQLRGLPQRLECPNRVVDCGLGVALGEAPCILYACHLEHA